MPASGRGANLDTTRRITAVRKPPPSPRQTTQVPSVNLRAPISATPFQPAQHAAQKKVERTARALPEQPHPHIPLLPHPTPAQTHAVLRLQQRRQRQSGLSVPDYYQALRNDPRSRPYVQALEHYARAGQGHYLATLGRAQAGGGENASAQYTPAAQGLTRAQAVALGRQVSASGRRETASAVTPVHRNALESTVIPLATSILPSLGSAAPALKPIEEAGIRKGIALGDALVKSPIGATRQTLTSIPETLNGLFAGTGRLVAEATLEGKPKTAVEQFVKGIGTDYVNRYGGLSEPGGIEKDAQRMVKEGYLPELLDATIAVGGPATVAGKAISRGVEATGYGAEDFARLVARREAERQVAQAPHAASPLARALTRGETRRATRYESATQPRPNLRVAPGDETPSPSPGAAVQPQQRAPNYFRGRAQTAIDNARRQRTIKGLQQQNAVRDALEADQYAPVRSPKPVQPLALEVRRGEVAPLRQHGGYGPHWPGAGFFGAAKQQRVGTSALKGEAVAKRTAEGKILEGAFNKLLKDATPEQRALLVHGKEGMLPLHDPEAAVKWLREVHAQAVAGSRPGGRSIIPLAERLTGSDVARETGKVLKYIDKNGAESVFGPQFEKLVQTIPDERLTAARDSSLSQDALTSRRYRPQVQMLERWAQAHPDDPLAHQTAAMTDQIKVLEREGGDLRKGRTHTDLTPPQRHELAAQKYATAKNLADDVARLHGLPTDRAYVEHTRRFTESNLNRTVGSTAPRIARQMEGSLMRQGYRSTDARLILNGMLKNIRNDYKIKYLIPWHKRYNIAPPGLTAHEAEEWLRASGRDPKHWKVANLGRLRHSIAEDLNAEHAQNFNLDAEAHAVHTTNQLDAALGENIPRSDTLKGAGVYPVAAINELKSGLAGSALGSRVLGKVKGTVSGLMLGTSLPWLTTMSTVTYPIQSLYSGAGVASLREAVGWYRGFDEAGKREIDRWFGIDSPFEGSTHDVGGARIGASAPKGRVFQELATVTHAAGDFPIAKLLRSMRPDHLILRMERVPRRYARINVAYKGVKTQALRELLKASKGMADEQHSFELGLARLQHFGRRPAKEYLDAALANQKAMEKHAVYLEKAMGEWKRTTQFERNILGRMVLFYPWLRYSVKLATRTLPSDHPLAYALALQYGSIQHDYLKELLGTDPTVGNIYLGPEQPKVKPENRQFKVIGARQANPLLNTISDLLGAESPAQVIDVLPPYISSFLEYAAGKNFFTDKPLKGAQPGETEYKAGKRPNLLNFLGNRALAVTNPGRTALKVTAHGRPASDEYLPGGDQFIRYSPKTLAKIRREQAKTGESTSSQLETELLPLIPHGDQGRIAAKIRDETRAADEAKSKRRKEHHAAHRLAGLSAEEEAAQIRQQSYSPSPSAGADPAYEEALRIREGR